MSTTIDPKAIFEATQPTYAAGTSNAKPKRLLCRYGSGKPVVELPIPEGSTIVIEKYDGEMGTSFTFKVQYTADKGQEIGAALQQLGSVVKYDQADERGWVTVAEKPGQYRVAEKAIRFGSCTKADF